MAERSDALAEIVEIARVHELSLAEIAAAMAPSGQQAQQSRSATLANIFSYIGGLLIVGGLTVLIHMQWPKLDHAGHVLITSIPAMLALCLGLFCTFDERLSKAASPLLVLAAMVLPTALTISLRESLYRLTPDQVGLAVCLAMAASQGALFWSRRRTVLAFTTVLFFIASMATAMDMEGIKPRYIGLTTGLTELSIAYALANSPHRTLAPVNYLFGSIFLLSGFGSCVIHTPLEVTYLGLCCLLIYASILVRSRALLGTSAFGMLGFIGYYSDKYFAQTLGWPITLIVGGGLMIGLGLFAMRLNERYIAEDRSARL